MKIEDKIQFTKVIRDHWVLKAKTGQTGIIKNIENNEISVELSNGEIIKTSVNNIKPYEKVEKFNIKTATSEHLLEEFERLTAHIWQTTNINTKSYQKMVNDADKIKQELLKRLNNK